MTYPELVTQLRTLGLPSTYHHWEVGKVPSLPYIIHFKLSRDSMGADNINYYLSQPVAIELYSEHHDFENEERIESLLTELGFYFTNDEAIFIESENMMMKRWEITLMKGK